MRRATAPLDVCKEFCGLRRFTEISANWLQN
jgi:hypothetical protein